MGVREIESPRPDERPTARAQGLSLSTPAEMEDIVAPTCINRPSVRLAPSEWNRARSTVRYSRKVIDLGRCSVKTR